MLSSDLLFSLYAFLFGAVWGSFGNVVIHRLPRGEGVCLPRSYCTSCYKQVPWYWNVPILSWFFLRGKCGFCKAPFSFRYPFVEALSGVFAVLLLQKYGLSWNFAEHFILFWGLLVISFIDFDHMIIPDEMSYGGIVIGFLGAALNPERTLADATLGLLMGGGFLWSVAYIYWLLKKVEGMGGGDIKLLAWIGTILGWKAIPFVIIGSSFIGSLGGVSLALLRGVNMKQLRIPFGPYLAMAAVVYVLFAESLGLWYLRIFFPWAE